MTTAKTALGMMREMCLSLADASESDHFGEACFRVGKRIFASCGKKDGACRLVFQLEPEHARRLIASDSSERREALGGFEPYARQTNCVAIDAANVKDWSQVRTLVLESYRLNKPGNRPVKRARASTRKKKKTARR